MRLKCRAVTFLLLISLIFAVVVQNIKPDEKLIYKIAVSYTSPSINLIKSFGSNTFTKYFRIKKIVQGATEISHVYQFKKKSYLKEKNTLSRTVVKVACVGDSNTKAQYPQFLQEYLGVNYNVKNFGEYGATLIDGSNFPYPKIDEYKRSLNFKPDIVLIMFGTNDANIKWCLNPDRKTSFIGSPQEEFKSEYIQLINSYKKENSKAVIYILTPLPVWVAKKPNKENIAEIKEQLNTWVIPIIREIAKEEHVKLIDVHQLMQNSFKYSRDGVHLTQEGYKVLAKKIAKKIF